MPVKEVIWKNKVTLEGVRPLLTMLMEEEIQIIAILKISVQISHHSGVLKEKQRQVRFQ